MRLIAVTLSLIAIMFASCDRKPKQKGSLEFDKYEQQQCDYFVQVVGVVDGDTFDGLTQDKIKIRFRIYGIDAPEKKQAFGDKSKRFLSDLVFKKKVGIKVQKERDAYGRPIVWAYTPDGKDVGAEMLKAGMAWHFKRYDSTQKYAEMENLARSKGLGLWRDTDPLAPWEYRHQR